MNRYAHFLENPKHADMGSSTCPTATENQPNGRTGRRFQTALCLHVRRWQQTQKYKQTGTQAQTGLSWPALDRRSGVLLVKRLNQDTPPSGSTGQGPASTTEHTHSVGACSVSWYGSERPIRKRKACPQQALVIVTIESIPVIDAPGGSW